MSQRLRLVEVIIQPIILADDGDNLVPVQVEPLRVAAADLDDFPDVLREKIVKLEEQFTEDYEEEDTEE